MTTSCSVEFHKVYTDSCAVYIGKSIQCICCFAEATKAVKETRAQAEAKPVAMSKTAAKKARQKAQKAK